MHRPESSKHGNKGLIAKRLANSKILQLPQIPETEYNGEHSTV